MMWRMYRGPVKSAAIYGHYAACKRLSSTSSPFLADELSSLQSLYRPEEVLGDAMK